MIKVTCLVENTSKYKQLKSKHGLCFYVETNTHKLLFDLSSNGLFLENAKKLNINITSIDTVVISHGHVDHGGALKLFMKENPTAKIYIRSEAFEKHTTNFGWFKIDVGLESNLQNNNQIIVTKDIERIDKELTLFVSKNRKFPLPSSNKKLWMYQNGHYTLDNFYHEQSLLIHDEDSWVLFGGCAHSSIVNILDTAESITGNKINTVISGFHLFNPVSRIYESADYIHKLGKELSNKTCDFYTCHCTGKKAFDILKHHIPNNLSYISVGETLLL